MPVPAKSYLPAFAGFLGTFSRHLNYQRFVTLTSIPVFAISYTTVVATKEGAAVDGARTRWQDQHTRARHAMSGGVTLADMERSLAKPQ
jgi:hypothetical protein